MVFGHTSHIPLTLQLQPNFFTNVTIQLSLPTPSPYGRPQAERPSPPVEVQLASVATASTSRYEFHSRAGRWVGYHEFPTSCGALVQRVLRRVVETVNQSDRICVFNPDVKVPSIHLPEESRSPSAENLHSGQSSISSNIRPQSSHIRPPVNCIMTSVR